MRKSSNLFGIDVLSKLNIATFLYCELSPLEQSSVQLGQSKLCEIKLGERESMLHMKVNQEI